MTTTITIDLGPVLRLLDEMSVWLQRFDADDGDRNLLAARLERFMTDLADAFDAAGLDIPADSWGDLMAELERIAP